MSPPELAEAIKKTEAMLGGTKPVGMNPVNINPVGMNPAGVNSAGAKTESRADPNPQIPANETAPKAFSINKLYNEWQSDKKNEDTQKSGTEQNQAVQNVVRIFDGTIVSGETV